MQIGGGLSAFKTPLHGRGGVGGRNLTILLDQLFFYHLFHPNQSTKSDLKSPIGGAAKGTPRNCKNLSPSLEIPKVPSKVPSPFKCTLAL